MPLPRAPLAGAHRRSRTARAAAARCARRGTARGVTGARPTPQRRGDLPHRRRAAGARSSTTRRAPSTCGSLSAPRDVVDRPARHAGRAERPQPLARVVRRANARAQHRQQRVAVLGRAPAKSAKRGSSASSGRPSAAHEPPPELLLRPPRPDPAVRGRERLERDDRRVRRLGACARARSRAMAAQVPDVGQQRQRRLEQRDVAVAADAVATRAPHAGQQRQRRDVAAREVDQREPGSSSAGRRARRSGSSSRPAPAARSRSRARRARGPVIPKPDSEQQTIRGLSVSQVARSVSRSLAGWSPRRFE